MTDSPASPPLGLDETPSLTASEVQLGDNWTLLLYTDGIYEGRVTGQQERLGIDGFLGVLRGDRLGARELDPEQLIDRVEELNEGPLDDDVALLALKRDARGH